MGERFVVVALGFKIIALIAICLGGFALVGASSGSPVSLHLIALPFVFILALLIYGLSGFWGIFRSKLFFLALPYLFMSLILAPFGVIFGFGPAHLVAASYFSAVVPFLIVFLGFVSWFKLENGRGLHRIVAVSIVLNFTMALAQIVSVYYGVELPIMNDLLNYQYDIKSQLSFNYDIRGRATGVFINPNDFGFWAVILLGYVWLYFKTPFFKNVSFIMLLFCLFASNSRGALVACAISIFIVYLSYFKTVSIGRFSAWAGFFIVALLMVSGEGLISQFSDLSEHSYAFLNRFSAVWDVVTGAAADDSLSGRYSAWANAFDVMYEYPFGTLVPPETLLNVATDNQYVYLLLQGNILFLFAYVFLLLGGALFFFKKNFHYLYWCSWVMLFFGFTAYPLNSYSMIMYWFFLGGAIRMSYSGMGARNA